MRGALLLLALSCGSSPSAPPVVIAAAPSCPPGTIFNGVSCAELLTRPEPDAGSAPAPTSVAAVDDARDPLGYAARSGSPTTLTAEADALEKLVAATGASSSDRPALLHRLARTYFEIGSARALERASEHWSAIVAQHPQFAAMDEVLYYAAYTRELSGDPMLARKLHFSLIQKYPASSLVAYAYYAFGEMFLAEAKTDPTKWVLAEQAYLEVARHAGRPALAAWTLLRLGQVKSARGDASAAARYFNDLKTRHPTSESAKQAP